ncbi:MAG: signal peptidase I [Candidatus Cellulosilyticum pullistercoris]|uniref:Signal peptidase I n=1 Tax=Candidatus Cellulosilyticum pullistercoris TaxID=2838521 RepID=A0A9E2NM73_9FIRM|nr:signal peptidase I [Candidatus Cellulosilyticum pullistercoris]
MNKKIESLKLIIETIKEPILAVLVAIVLIPSFIISNTKVPTESMMPAINPGDHLIVSRLPYYYRDPVRGEIVVFKYNDDFLIKRIIAVPGDQIDIKDNKVYINGELLDETAYLTKSVKTYLYAGSKVDFPYTIPDDYYFVMGDNRLNSKDSRVFGAIPRSSIIAKAGYRIFPLSIIGKIE